MKQNKTIRNRYCTGEYNVKRKIAAEGRENYYLSTYC